MLTNLVLSIYRTRFQMLKYRGLLMEIQEVVLSVFHMAMKQQIRLLQKTDEIGRTTE